MSKLAKLGFDTSKPIKWVNALATSAIAELNGYPYNIDQTATPEQWAALQQDLTDKVVTVAQYAPPPPFTPPKVKVVTMRQARLALLAANLLNQVIAAIANLPSPQKEAAQIEWEYSNEVQRDGALVKQLAGSLGLTDTALDNLFEQAATL